MTPLRKGRSKPFAAITVAFLAVSYAACEGEELLGPIDAIETGNSMGFAEVTPDSREIRLMTRNVYQGFSTLAPLLEAPPQQVPVVAAGIFAEVVATDFPARAERLADEIAFSQPHVVGLQEVSRFRQQVPADFALNASDDVYDFLAILLEALEERGLDYEVAANVQNVDAEVPIVWPGSPNGLADIRLTDRDVILVRSGWVPRWDNREAFVGHADFNQQQLAHHGEPISLGRLEARPIATMTHEAQEHHERIERVSRDD